MNQSISQGGYHEFRVGRGKESYRIEKCLHDGCLVQTLTLGYSLNSAGKMDNSFQPKKLKFVVRLLAYKD